MDKHLPQAISFVDKAFMALRMKENEFFSDKNKFDSYNRATFRKGGDYVGIHILGSRNAYRYETYRIFYFSTDSLLSETKN